MTARMVHAVQDQLPAPVHHRRLDDLIVTDPGVGDSQIPGKVAGIAKVPYGMP
jgi:hypothetical protein